MFKKFTDGLFFGGGFAVSFVVIWYVAMYLIFPVLFSSGFEQSVSRHSSGHGEDNPEALTQRHPQTEKPEIPFYKLDIDEKIKQSSVIALAKYEKTPEGKTKAVISEFLKKKLGVTIYYNVGDEYPMPGYRPGDEKFYGDGQVIFFTGSPATMKFSTSFSGDRISSLGDLPVVLLRKKCKE